MGGLITLGAYIRLRYINKSLKDKRASLIDQLIEVRAKLENEIEHRKTREAYLNRKNLELTVIIKSLVLSPIKVYTMSNFYGNYNYHNGRFYAKINQNKTNNKAEGIPFIPVIGSESHVIDIYNLKKSLKVYKDREMSREHIETLIFYSTRLKETIIEELGNKILKSYRD